MSTGRSGPGSSAGPSSNSGRDSGSPGLQSRWIFTAEQLLAVPSIKEGITPEKELEYRRAAAHAIHQMADRLNHESRVRISQLCICAAMMHMHRFFVFHSFKKFDPIDIAAACLFLAGKSEECPRKLEHVVRVWWTLKFPNFPSLDQSHYHDASQLIVTLENVVLQTIAFDLSVDIPHPYVLTHMQAFTRGNRRISEIAYWFASDMLHMTCWGVRYSARAIACVCIQMACYWAEFQIQLPDWFKEVDPTMTSEKLIELTEEFSVIYKKFGDQLSIKKYAIRNSLRDSFQRRSVPQPSLLPPPASSASLSSLPPPPPAPQLTPNVTVKTEIKTEPARRIDINDYKQRSGVSGVPNSVQSSAQQPGSRRNFMQPDSVSQAGLVKGSVELDLPLPPAIANEKKSASLSVSVETKPASAALLPPLPAEVDVRQKRRFEDQEREKDIAKHRKPENTQDEGIGGSSKHRKRVHERSPQTKPPALPVNVSAHHSGQISGSSQLTGAAVPGGTTSLSSIPRPHEGISSASKRPKPSTSLNQLVPPPPPPQALATANIPLPSRAMPSQFAVAPSVQQHRSSDNTHRDSHLMSSQIAHSSPHKFHSSSSKAKGRESVAQVPLPPAPEAPASSHTSSRYTSPPGTYAYAKRSRPVPVSPASNPRTPPKPSSYSNGSSEGQLHNSSLPAQEESRFSERRHGGHAHSQEGLSSSSLSHSHHHHHDYHHHRGQHHLTSHRRRYSQNEGHREQQHHHVESSRHQRSTSHEHEHRCRHSRASSTVYASECAALSWQFVETGATASPVAATERRAGRR